MHTEYSEILTTTIAGTIVLIILVGIVVFIVLFHQRQRLIQTQALSATMQVNQLLKTKIELQDEVLHKVGQELHDNIGQLLSVVKLYLGSAKKIFNNVPESFTDATDVLTKAIDEVRAISHLLNRQSLKKFNLFENVSRVVKRINSANGIRVTLTGCDATLPLSSDAQVDIFRIVQEAIQNCIKHAQASHIEIKLETALEQLCITVTDNGRGFDTAGSTADGVGKLNMRERTALLNGTIEWESSPQSGTTVRIIIPFGGITSSFS